MSIISSNSLFQLEDSINSVINQPCHLESQVHSYVDLLKTMDGLLTERGVDAMIRVLKDFDASFKASAYRKAHFYTKGRFSRRILTKLGEISFEREYYVPKCGHGDGFFYVDDQFHLPHRDYFDPTIKAMILESSAIYSYAQTGEIVSGAIGTRFKDFQSAPWRRISRQTVYNVVKAADIAPPITKPLSLTPDTIYVQMDEKFVHTQNHNKKDCELKLAVVYDGIQAVSKTRNRLVNRHVLGSIENVGTLRDDLADYLSKTYDLSKIKFILVSGDGAGWIKHTAPFLKLSPQIHPVLILDRFHTFQAINRMTTNPDIRSVLRDYLLHNRAHDLKRMADCLIQTDPDRQTVILENLKYLLSNWQSIQNQRHPFFRGCSMEGHISHFAASLFTARPKGHSLSMIAKRLASRLDLINGNDVQRQYLVTHSDLIPEDDISIDTSHSPYSVLDSTNHKVSFLYRVLKAAGEMKKFSDEVAY